MLRGGALLDDGVDVIFFGANAVDLQYKMCLWAVLRVGVDPLRRGKGSGGDESRHVQRGVRISIRVIRTEIWMLMMAYCQKGLDGSDSCISIWFGLLIGNLLVGIDLENAVAKLRFGLSRILINTKTITR